MTKTKTYLAVLICFFTTLACAQAPKPQTFTVKGAVTDSLTGKPLGFVTVALTDAATKQPVKSSLTKDDGLFELKNVPVKSYRLSLVYVGYKSKVLNIKGDKAIDDIGKIVLSPSNSQLKEVAVTAAKPLMKQEIDRLTYDIQADPENKVMTVLDMMRKVPMLSLDADDNIKLKGGSNYKIFINGKPSSMVAHNPKDVLRAMPASSIEKIEVITTPPAKYDSEGLDGIINIITNKRVDNGYNGSINSRFSLPTGGPNVGGSYTVKQGKFGASGYFGVGKWSQPETQNSSSRITTGTNASTLSQLGRNKNNSNNGYLGTEFSYEIDTLNLLTAEVSVYGNKNSSSGVNSSFTQAAQNIAYTLLNDNKGNYNSYDFSLNYQLGFKSNKNRLLTFSYRSNNGKDGSFNNQGLTDTLNYHSSSFLQNNDEHSHEQTFQADYVHPLKKVNIEGGLKAILRDNSSNFEYDSLSRVTNQYVINPTRSNQYNNNQYVLGAYNSYQYNAKNWGFKVGGRIEETMIRADFITNATNVDRNYFNIVPSVNINHKFKNMSSINFGYTQRIQRPDIYQLNPFVDRSNPSFQSTGNPGLNPVVSNNFQLNYSRFKKGSINLGLNYNFASNTVQNISVYDPTTGITRTNYANIGKNRSFGTNFNVNYPITKSLSFTMSGNLNYLFIQGMINNVLTKNDGVQGYAYGYFGYKFKNGLRLNASANYSSAYITLQGKSSSYFGSNLSITKDIVKDKLTFGTYISNPFTKYRNYIRETTGPNFIQNTFYQNYYRSFSFSLNYRFGKLQQDIKKNKRSINNDDTAGKSSGN